MKLCILQMADTGPAESTAQMLESVGYTVRIPNEELLGQLRQAGLDTVLGWRDLVRGMGYDPLEIPEVGPEAMSKCKLFCDIKAHRNYEHIIARWPNLRDRVLWTRINGAQPEHVVNARGDHGDEVNPPCPVLTPNLWYAEQEVKHTSKLRHFGMKEFMPGGECEIPEGSTLTIGSPTPWAGRAYACWPPFVKVKEYDCPRPQSKIARYQAPICLIHNIGGWGYQALLPNFREHLGIRCFGAASPDGLIPHSHVKAHLSSVLCMVHLKSNDAPGYALYEALASGCPVVCTRRLIWRNRMQDLLIPGVTCLVFDRETHDGLSDKDVTECTEEVREHLKALGNSDYNRQIGEAGKQQLLKVMWSKDKTEDVESLRAFMAKNFVV